MKKYIAALTACALIAVSGPALAAGKDKKAAGTAAEKTATATAKDEDAKKTLETRYWDMRMAIKAGDAAQYRKNMAADFTGIDLNNNKRTADQIVTALSHNIRDDSRKEQTTIDSVKLEGNKAQVAATYDLETKRKAVNGSMINYHMVTKSNDVWVKMDGKWLLQKTEAETGDVYINGKLVAHRARGDGKAPAPGAKKDAAAKAANEKPASGATKNK